MFRLDTDVLVIGSGPAGASAALALATYGVRTTVITKYGWPADTPRAPFRHAAALSDVEAGAALESGLRTVLDTAGIESVAGGQA